MSDNAMLATETLDRDVATLLGVDNVSRVHENASSTSNSKMQLSEFAKSNLRKFLDDDYRAIKKLLEFSPTTHAEIEILLA